MRKLLLAGVAVLGGWSGGSAGAGAQTFTDVAGQTSSPAPGTVTVRLNGRFRFYAALINDSDANNNASTTATGTVNATTGQGTASGANKQDTYTFADFARLYPGFDGVAANGLKYGASLEIRQDQVSGAGGGIYGSISQQDRARSGLYFRREWGYIGTDQLGTVRLGSTDSPASLYMTGNFENFNDGGINGDVPGLPSQALQTIWPFADVGNIYTTMKAIYLSPQFFGFDAGVSFEPNTGNVSINNSCGSGGPLAASFINSNNGVASGAAGISSPAIATGANGQSVSGPGCERLSSSPNNSESGRRRNTLDALIRYRGTFGGFGIAATAGYIESGNVKDDQSGVAYNSNPLRNGGVIRNNFDGLNVGDFGVALTYGGFSVGGKYQFGRFNGQWSLTPHGLADGEAILGGFSYTYGPIIVGAHYLDYKSAGDVGNAANGRQRREKGVGAGGTYSLAPGLSLFLSYLWSERKQNGYDFVTGQGVSATSPGGTLFNNKVTSQLISLGTAFSW